MTLSKDERLRLARASLEGLSVSGLGVRDTNCAIVSGIVVLHAGNSIPAKRLASRESLVNAGRL